MAQDQTLCLPVDLAALSGSALNTGGQNETPVAGSPVLAHSDMVLKPGQSAEWSSLGVPLRPNLLTLARGMIWHLVRICGNCGCGP